MQILSWQIHHGPDLCLSQVLEKLWKYAKKVYACFSDLDKAYDCVPRDKLWVVLLEYDVEVSY